MSLQLCEGCSGRVAKGVEGNSDQEAFFKYACEYALDHPDDVEDNLGKVAIDATYAYEKESGKAHHRDTAEWAVTCAQAKLEGRCKFNG